MSAQPDAFASPKRCIARAEMDTRKLHRAALDFFAKKPWAVIIEPDAETGRHFLKLKMTRRLPIIVTDRAGDAMDRLRSALDQAGFAVACARGLTDAKSSNFPFADNAADLENTIKRKCRDLPAEVVAVMRSFKPYGGGDTTLWGLNKSRQANQHRLIRPVLNGAPKIILSGIVASGHLRPIADAEWDSGKNEITIGETSADAELQHNVFISPDIVFDNVAGLSGQSVYVVLKQMIETTKRIVSAIEAETRRLGLIA